MQFHGSWRISDSINRSWGRWNGCSADPFSFPLKMLIALFLDNERVLTNHIIYRRRERWLLWQILYDTLRIRCWRWILFFFNSVEKILLVTNSGEGIDSTQYCWLLLAHTVQNITFRPQNLTRHAVLTARLGTIYELGNAKDMLCLPNPALVRTAFLKFPSSPFEI